MSPHDAPRLRTDNQLNDPNDIQLFLFGATGGGGQASSKHTGQEQSRLDAEDPRRRTAVRAMMGRGPSGELGFIR